MEYKGIKRNNWQNVTANSAIEERRSTVGAESASFAAEQLEQHV